MLSCKSWAQSLSIPMKSTCHLHKTATHIFKNVSHCRMPLVPCLPKFPSDSTWRSLSLDTQGDPTTPIILVTLKIYAHKSLHIERCLNKTLWVKDYYLVTLEIDPIPCQKQLSQPKTFLFSFLFSLKKDSHSDTAKWMQFKNKFKAHTHQRFTKEKAYTLWDILLEYSEAPII